MIDILKRLEKEEAEILNTLEVEPGFPAAISYASNQLLRAENLIYTRAKDLEEK